MTNPIAAAALADLPEGLGARIAQLPPRDVPRGTVLFHPGDCVQGFVLVLQGRIDVFLTGPTGREILLYSVEPGQSCVQTTLGLLGGEPYAGEAIAATDCLLIVVPSPLFLTLMDEAAGFRSFVFTAFAQRMQGMLQVLERVAFTRVECRLAAVLLDLAEGIEVRATQFELATRIGSAREVVSRRLESFARLGLVRTERGKVELIDVPALRRLALADE
jgi:CRP/FNR family transcriptional regulator